jgi:hypothetical protein
MFNSTGAMNVWLPHRPLLFHSAKPSSYPPSAFFVHAIFKYQTNLVGVDFYTFHFSLFKNFKIVFKKSCCCLAHNTHGSSFANLFTEKVF